MLHLHPLYFWEIIGILGGLREPESLNSQLQQFFHAGNLRIGGNSPHPACMQHWEGRCQCNRLLIVGVLSAVEARFEVHVALCSLDTALDGNSFF